MSFLLLPLSWDLTEVVCKWKLLNYEDALTCLISSVFFAHCYGLYFRIQISFSVKVECQARRIIIVSFALQLDKAAPVLAGLKEPIVIAKVNADKFPSLANKYEIE